jgi:DinB superfamily
MTPLERDKLILKYKDGYDELLKSLEGFPERELAARPIPNKWSAREIIHHLADSETVSGIRLKRLLVEDHPLIQGYDQEAFAKRLNYNDRDIGPALDAFRSARANTAQLIDLMTEEDWKREGTHSESGSYTAEDWLNIYADHGHNHAAQILRLRERLVEKQN